MREIKFRAWDVGRNIMIGSDYPKNWGDNSDEWYFDLARMQLTGIEDISKDTYHIVMQYTGLKDKNGKEVYESDVGNDKFNNKVIVKWNEQFYCYALLTIDEVVKDDWNFDLNDLNEIVGNIYENPELIKEEEDEKAN